ncbi:MAG: hypothetical protein C7B47_17860, partial [Sulfobacillus thermosulfidooxidans]
MVLWRIYRLDDGNTAESAVVQDTGSDPVEDAVAVCRALAARYGVVADLVPVPLSGGRTLWTMDGRTDTGKRLQIHAWVVN